MSTRPSTGRRPRRGGEEVDMFGRRSRRAIKPAAGRAKDAKIRANRRDRRAGRQRRWID